MDSSSSGASQELTKEDFNSVLTLSQKEAAKALNVCLSTFKRRVGVSAFEAMKRSGSKSVSAPDGFGFVRWQTLFLFFFISSGLPHTTNYSFEGSIPTQDGPH